MKFKLTKKDKIAFSLMAVAYMALLLVNNSIIVSFCVGFGVLVVLFLLKKYSIWAAQTGLQELRIKYHNNELLKNLDFKHKGNIVSGKIGNWKIKFKTKLSASLGIYFILVLDYSLTIGMRHIDIWKMFDKCHLKISDKRIIATKWIPDIWSYSPNKVVRKISKIIKNIEKEL